MFLRRSMATELSRSRDHILRRFVDHIHPHTTPLDCPILFFPFISDGNLTHYAPEYLTTVKTGYESVR